MEQGLEPAVVAVLTPRGRGAVATVVVDGERAVSAVSQRFQVAAGVPLADRPVNQVVFGRWSSGEEVVVCRRSGQRVEIHCHGGDAAVDTIVSALLEAGCQLIDATDWLAREEPDPFAAEARAALAEARTDRVAAVLLDQYRGALRNAFAEVERMQAAGQFADAQRVVDELRGRVEFGRHLTTPWRVVLAGRPNVGKSSLLNALLGYSRAIVFDQPGTTRDVVTAQTAIDGWPVELADTAGLRDSNDPLEAAGIDRATRTTANADLVLLVFDATQPWTSEDEQFVASFPRGLVVFNKRDLPAAQLPRPSVFVSAATGTGIDELLAAISRALVPNPPPPGTAVPFREWHAVSLQVRG